MMTKTLAEQVAVIAADTLEVPVSRISPASSPETIDTWDSIHHLNLVLALELQFDVQFEPEEIDQMKTFDQIVKLLASKAGNQ